MRRRCVFVTAWVVCGLLSAFALATADYIEAFVPVLLMLWWGAERRRADAERVTRLALEDSTRRQEAGRELRSLLLTPPAR